MPQRYRAMFINSLSGYKSANLVGTSDGDGNTNLSIVSSVFHLGADPALMGMIVRPASVRRDTLENILSTQSYTLNHVHPEIYQQAHQTSARYDQFKSEFDVVGLTPAFESDFHAPYVKESKLSLGLQLREHKTLEINGTEMLIGEIMWVNVIQEAVTEDGYIDIESLQSICISGLDGYHTTQQLSRLEYAKPDLKTREKENWK